MNVSKRLQGVLAIAVLFFLGAPAAAQTLEPAQIRGDTDATQQGWRVQPLVTVGETWVEGRGFRPDENAHDVNEIRFGYRPVGILDGIGAFPVNAKIVRLLVNHELGGNLGATYQLANGTELVGARVSFFDVHRFARRVVAIGPAYDTMFDRAGDEVVDVEQIGGGLNRLCSSHGFQAGELGLVDNVYFTGEETSGGVEYVLDVDEGDLYAAPMMGYAAWENVTAVENFGSDKVLVLVGDDRGGAPLILYVGEKGATPGSLYSPPEFLVRNGLGMGNLYVWVADDPAVRSPADWNGTGTSHSGKFVKIAHFDPSMAGVEVAEGLSYDELGFVNQALQDSLAFGNEEAGIGGAGAFRFSRPEDVSPNPEDSSQIVLASTGRGSLFPEDDWGTIYVIDLDDESVSEQLEGDLDDIDELVAGISILYDGDDAGGQFPGPDFGIRSPDNLDWADNGFIYVNEDRSTGLFGVGGTERDGAEVEGSGIEASVWQLDPETGKAVRILEMDRGAVPVGQADPSPYDIGNWESSGVLDVTKLFPTYPRETLLILDTQAHSLCGGGLAFRADQGADLVQGGQLLFASKIMPRPERDEEEDEDDDEKDDDDDGHRWFRK